MKANRQCKKELWSSPGKTSLEVVCTPCTLPIMNLWGCTMPVFPWRDFSIISKSVDWDPLLIWPCRFGKVQAEFVSFYRADVLNLITGLFWYRTRTGTHPHKPLRKVHKIKENTIQTILNKICLGHYIKIWFGLNVFRICWTQPGASAQRRCLQNQNAHLLANKLLLLLNGLLQRTNMSQIQHPISTQSEGDVTMGPSEMAPGALSTLAHHLCWQTAKTRSQEDRVGM